jgi:uncharacterized membrane protein
MPRLSDVFIRTVFGLLVLLGIAAAVLRIVAPTDLLSHMERVRLRAVVALGIPQPTLERRAHVVAAADRKFATHRTITRVHVLTGAGFLALASLQLVRRVRTRTPRLHRVAGRIAIVLAWLSGLTGLYFGVWQPLAGFAEQLIVGIVGCFLLVAVSLALVHIRAGRVEAHREWMLRGVAAALAIASVRLVAIPLDFVLTPRGVDINVVFALSLWVGWAVTMCGAEWWIRVTRVRVPRVIPGAV